MENEEKMTVEEKIIGYFTNIKGFCDSAIDSVSGKDKGDTDVFKLTENIQEEIEEIRDLVVRVTGMLDIKTEKELKPVKAKFGDTVRVHFTCKLEDDTVHDSSIGQEPLEFIIGENQFIPAFEKTVIGMTTGTSKRVKIPSDLAYGPRQDEKVVVISRDEFPENIDPEPGLQFQIKKNDGGTSYVTVTEVNGSKITLDANHPMSGKDLFFELELVEIVKSGPSAIVCFRLGSMLQDSDQLDGAISWYTKAIQIDPDFTEAYYNLGVALQLSNRWDEAISSYQAVIELKPDHRDAYHNLGNAYKEAGKSANAMECYQKALDLDPAFANAHNSVGTLLQEKGEIDKAIESYKKATEYNADFHEAYFNIGTALQEKGHIDEAIKYYQDALRIKSDFPEAHVRLSSAFLLSGKFKEGWREYEWRYATDKAISQIHYFPQTVWDGSPVTGKTLMIYAEQGVGDEIMFASCIPDVTAQSDSNYIIECDNRLVPLFSRSFPAAQVIARLQINEVLSLDFQNTDLKIATGSLPKMLRPDLNSFPKRKQYLKADDRKVTLWHDRFADMGDGLKIGISWRSGAKPSVQCKHSISLIQLLQSIAAPGIHFINLQYGDCKSEIEEVKENSGISVLDWDDIQPLTELDNFAAAIDALDLVISVDNASVHLAGSLGKPVWTLLPFAPDWRWMLEREDSPWYPTMKLFRQPSAGDWQSVIKQVKKELKLFNK